MLCREIRSASVTLLHCIHAQRRNDRPLGRCQRLWLHSQRRRRARRVRARSGLSPQRWRSAAARLVCHVRRRACRWQGSARRGSCAAGPLGRGQESWRGRTCSRLITKAGRQIATYAALRCMVGLATDGCLCIGIDVACVAATATLVVTARILDPEPVRLCRLLAGQARRTDRSLAHEGSNPAPLEPGRRVVRSLDRTAHAASQVHEGELPPCLSLYCARPLRHAVGDLLDVAGGLTVQPLTAAFGPKANIFAIKEGSCPTRAFGQARPRRAPGPAAIAPGLWSP